MDFMSDSLMGIRKFRTLNVMDDCSREALAIEIDTYRRPHEALNNLTPDEWKRKLEITEINKLNTVC